MRIPEIIGVKISHNRAHRAHRSRVSLSKARKTSLSLSLASVTGSATSISDSWRHGLAVPRIPYVTAELIHERKPDVSCETR